MLDAISTGTTDGLYLALNVGAMLISFISLIALLNKVLEFGSYEIQQLFNYFGFSFTLPIINLSYIFFWFFSLLLAIYLALLVRKPLMLEIYWALK